MMPQQDLSAFFVTELNKAVPHRKELVYRIADILNIETESAYRRLAGTVKFSISELGLLSREMNISIDSLLHPGRTNFFLDLGVHSSHTNMDSIVRLTEEFIGFWNNIESEKLYAGAVYSTMPVEFFMHHPHLCRYMYFKWGHYFIGTKEYDHFSSWELPSSLCEVHLRLQRMGKEVKNVVLFWDTSLMPNLVNEINYHLLIGILAPDDALAIKKDLHDQLENFEQFLKDVDALSSNHEVAELQCYITNLSVSVTGRYFIGEGSYLSLLRASSFLHSSFNYSRDAAIKMSRCVNSLKKISSLISGGCEKERLTFFRKQHEMVNLIGIS